VHELLERETLSAAEQARYAEAIAFAEEAHRGQKRKGSDLPYMVHPLEAAALLAHHYPGREALVVAGILHDTLEDTRASRRQLADRFGQETARLVDSVTRRWWRAPWRLDVSDRDVVRLKAADCASNIRSTIVDLRAEGPSVWRRFRGGEPVKRDYYGRLVPAIAAAIPGEPLAARLVELAEMLEAEPQSKPR
jgi:(p)ppGpp synthase/HD superfamily hydrolase